MEIYDTEEEQVAAIKRWWKENGTSTIVGVAVGIIIIFGWNFWQDYNKTKANQASSLYDQLLQSIEDEKTESAEQLIKQINTEYGSTSYATYASLFEAKLKVQQGDAAAAKKILEKIMSESGSAELKNVARLRVVKLLQAAGEFEQGLQLIAEADQTNVEGFSPNYDELKGDLYVALDRLGEARTAYQSALRAGQTSPLLQFKIDDITAADIVEATPE